MLRQSTDQVIRFILTIETTNNGMPTANAVHTGDSTATVILCKTGATPAASTNSIAELGNGVYSLDLTTTETNTIGDLAIVITYNSMGNVLSIREHVVSQAAYDGSGGSDPWATALPGSYSSGQAGYILGTNLNATVSSRSTYSGGAVASVTGNVGGNVLGAVGSISGVSFPTNFATLAIDANGRVKIQAGINKNTALANFSFWMYSAADHVTPITGRTVTAQRSINGAALGPCANSVVEVGGGEYAIDLAASDLNGNVITFQFSAPGADDTLITVVPAQ